MVLMIRARDVKGFTPSADAPKITTAPTRTFCVSTGMRGSFASA